jgi:hypothetical protein
MRYLLVLILLCGATGCENKPAKPRETQVVRIETPAQAGIHESLPEDAQFDDEEVE